MVKQTYKAGNVFEIPIVEGVEFFYYGQCLGKGIVKIFDFKSRNHLSNLNDLLSCKTLFTVPMYSDIITKKYWKVVGNIPVIDNLETLYFFIYHEFDVQKWERYNAYSGSIEGCSKEDCVNLEECAVWDKHHIEDRIADYYNDRPCKWLKSTYELFPERLIV